MKRCAVLALTLTLLASAAHADPMSCALDSVRAQPGLTVWQAGDVLTVQWDGDRNQQLRMQFALRQGTPTIHELAVRRPGSTGGWGVVAADAIPDYRVISGLRRMSNQQMAPLRGLGVDLTTEIVDTVPLGSVLGRAARCDAALGPRRQPAAGGRRRQSAGSAAQAGRNQARRRPSIARTACTVKTNGARLEIRFPACSSACSAASLQYSIFKGSNLIQQEILATTNEPWVAYKYDAGLKGLTHRWRRARRVARHREQLAGVPVRRRQERRRGAAQDEQPHRRRRARRRRIDRRVSAAAHVLLGARDRDQPRLQLVSQGQRRVVLASASGRPSTKTSPRTRPTSRSTARGRARRSA